MPLPCGLVMATGSPVYLYRKDITDKQVSIKFSAHYRVVKNSEKLQPLINTNY